MKKWPFFLCLIQSALCYAVNPVEGLYVGGFFGATYEPNFNFNINASHYLNGTRLPSNVTLPTTTGTNGTLGFQVLIDAGGQIGYRFCNNYRLELEGMYNKNPYNFLRIGNTTFHNHGTSTAWRIDGGTTSGIGFFNGYYDFLGDGTHELVPFAGLGIGYAYVYNAVKFYYNEQLVNPTDTSARSHAGRPAGQAIVGLSYFMDDFFSVGVDARYIATAKQNFTSRFNNSHMVQLQVYAINLFFNGALEIG